MPVKTKTENSAQTLHSISAVRQLIRRKLIEAGLQWDTGPKKIDISKIAKQKSRQRPRDTQNLPILQSHRSKNLPISEFNNVFSHHCPQLQSHRQSNRKFSNARPRKYNQLIQSPRDFPYLVRKQSLVPKRIDTARQNEELIPWLKRFQLHKNQPNTTTQPINIIRLFENKPKKEKAHEGSSARRSKTEEKETHKQTILDKFLDLKREITPWQFQIARDTLIRFQ